MAQPDKPSYTKLRKKLKNYDKEGNIWELVNKINTAWMTDIQNNIKDRNVLINGLNALEDNIQSYIFETDMLNKLKDLNQDYQNQHTLTDKIKKLHEKYTLLNSVIDNKVKPPEYSTLEEIG